MNRWDIVLLVVAGYVAVTALVRLMTRRRDQLLDELRQHFKKSKRRKKPSMQEKGRRDRAA
ncbi:MAG TPA: hypothetical protein VMY37_23080 [Thermoguttaceae bacterium]|nr:hypothetical protein [Thermoguttaceae bacterium]